jgi:hypothetical protein
MSSGSFGSIAVLTISLVGIVGCAVSEPLDLKADLGNFDGSQTTTDGSATATGGSRPSSQGSGGTAGASARIGAGGTSGGASGLGGTPGTAGNLGGGASGGASGQVGGGHGGVTGTAGGGGGSRGVAGTAGGGGGSRGVAGTAGGGGGSRGVAGTAGGGGEGGGGHVGTSAAPTFTEIYKNILSVSVYCGGSTCHNPGSQQGVGFSTQAGAYKSLANYAIIPGDSQGSSLYTLVATGVMPDGRPMLSSDFIDEIGAWIDAGALNN